MSLFALNPIAAAIRSSMSQQPVLPLTFVGASDTQYVTDNSLTETLPSTAEPGDLMIASVMHRDELTVPSSWDLVVKADAFDPINDVDHFLSLYVKRVNSEDVGAEITVTQASSQRMSFTISVFRNATVKTVLKAEDGISNGIVDIPELEALSNEISLCAATTNYGVTSNSHEVTVSSGWSQITPESSGDGDNGARTGLAYREGPGVHTGTWDFDFPSSYDSAACVHVILNYQPGPTPHKYWRVRITDTNDSGSFKTNIAELEFRAYADGDSLSTGGLASANTDAGAGYEASNAFDGDKFTWWTGGQGDPLPQWVQYEHSEEVSVVEVAITSGDNSTLADRAPKDFTIEYSDDGLEWVVAAEFLNEPSWGETETRVFPVSY